MEVHIIPVGASIQRIMVPDKDGFIADVVLGFDSADEYLVSCCTCGSVVANTLRLCSVDMECSNYDRITQRALEPLLGGW